MRSGLRLPVLFFSFFVCPIFAMNNDEFQNIGKTLKKKYDIHLTTHSGAGHFKHVGFKDNTNTNIRVGYYRPYRYDNFIKGKDKNMVMLFLEEPRLDENREIEFAQKRIIESPNRSEDFIIPGVCSPNWAVYLTDNPNYRDDTFKTIEILHRRKLISDNIYLFITDEYPFMRQ